MNHCGTCTLCCKLLAIPELDKPSNQWCHLVQLGKPPEYKHGCSIYENKPNSCNVYQCAYLTSQSCEFPWPLKCRPDHVHIVISEPVDMKFATAHVDPSYPNIWDSELAAQLLKACLETKPVMVLVGGVFERMLVQNPEQADEAYIRDVLGLERPEKIQTLS